MTTRLWPASQGTGARTRAPRSGPAGALCAWRSIASWSYAESRIRQPRTPRPATTRRAPVGASSGSPTGSIDGSLRPRLRDPRSDARATHRRRGRLPRGASTPVERDAQTRGGSREVQTALGTAGVERLLLGRGPLNWDSRTGNAGECRLDHGALRRRSRSCWSHRHRRGGLGGDLLHARGSARHARPPPAPGAGGMDSAGDPGSACRRSRSTQSRRCI